MRRGGLLAIAAFCVGIATYGGVSTIGFAKLFGDGDAYGMSLSDLPGDAMGLIKRCFEVLGNPKENFRKAMTGIENNARASNPSSRGGHGDYSMIYEILDINTAINLLREDGSLGKSLNDMPSDAAGLVKRTYELLGDPKENFRKAMDGFERMASIRNPRGRVSHGDYSKIYEMLDTDSFKDFFDGLEDIDTLDN